MAAVPLSRYVGLFDRDTLLRKRWRTRDTPRFSGRVDDLLRVGRRKGWWRGARTWRLLAAGPGPDGLVLTGPRGGRVHLHLSPRVVRPNRKSGTVPAAVRPPRADWDCPGISWSGCVGLQVVTLGAPVVAECRRLGREGRVLEQFLLHGLAAELTEALAEWSAASIAARAGWNGHRRYSPGYPVWPELSEQRKVFRLLRPSRIGVRLTRSFQMVPEYSTSAIVLPVGPRD